MAKAMKDKPEYKGDKPDTPKQARQEAKAALPKAKGKAKGK